MDLDKTFPSKEEALQYVHDCAQIDGYYVTTSRSKKDMRFWMKCDLGGMYHPSGNGTRECSTRLTDCPYKVIFRYFKKEDYWKIIKVDGEDNHEPSMNGTGHSVARRLKEDEKARVRELAINGVQATRILSTLKKSRSLTTTIPALNTSTIS
jgi:hypothetical protein